MIDRIAPLIDTADAYLRKFIIFPILADYPYSCQALRFLLSEYESDPDLTSTIKKCVSNITSP